MFTYTLLSRQATCKRTRQTRAHEKHLQDQVGSPAWCQAPTCGRSSSGHAKLVTHTARDFHRADTPHGSDRSNYLTAHFDINGPPQPHRPKDEFVFGVCDTLGEITSDVK